VIHAYCFAGLGSSSLAADAFDDWYAVDLAPATPAPGSAARSFCKARSPRTGRHFIEIVAGGLPPTRAEVQDPAELPDHFRRADTLVVEQG
jgi:hypothetical protein